MNKLNVLLLILSIVTISVADYQYAQCRFSGSESSGTVALFGPASGEYLMMKFNIDYINLEDKTYGASIMTFGFNPTNASNLGGVFDNKGETTVGCPGNENGFRVGDLGNIEVASHSISTLFNLTKPSLLSNSTASVIGRSISINIASYDCSNPTNTVLAQSVATCVIGIGGVVPQYVKDIDTSINFTTGVNVASASSELDKTVYDAIAVVSNTTKFIDNTISGQVLFRTSTTSNTISILAAVNGVSNETHGFHIHAFGDLTALNGTSVGGHWLTAGQVHSFPNSNVNSTKRHYGDLGNVCIFNTQYTTVYYKLETTYFPFSGLVGRGFAVHAQRDDGNAFVGGNRVAQGVVALVSKTPTTVVQIPSNWVFEQTCPNGTYTGESTIVDDSSISGESSQPGTSSFLAPLFGLVLISLISTLLF